MIHKQVEKENIKNWRPITMLNSAYKIYAKAIALRLSSHMKEWINKEQKGFIKGRYILDAIIAIWEGMECAEETEKNYIFFKIDFEKAYDKVSWKYILESLKQMGCGKEFCIMVKTLLGNAATRVNVNGELIEAFKLSHSIKQSCPLAPLLYAIAADGLT